MSGNVGVFVRKKGLLISFLLCLFLRFGGRLFLRQKFESFGNSRGLLIRMIRNANTYASGKFQFIC